ncbi:amidohydrolase [Sphingomonas sp. Leaf407]|uniref:amidohydrolase family protein n=1 Tax=unclassified Sphingomonas TaxID=196159 RepID=UPI0006FDE62B|nr:MULTISPECIES: amidohydrolase family protein [unclassified Sphingomonas]KQN37043.1 amidohydrolase [Sphingomonas sp. Leaf42]KQT30470.1 amidohydrolase [Sphingomonas sp. Leaf407]
MAGLPFIDAHVHLWDLDHLRYPWLTPPFADDGPNGSVEPIARTYLLDDYRADAGAWDVRGIVHVDAGAEASAALDETRWLQGMADTAGMPNAIVAFADLSHPDVDTLLAAHAAHANVRGIRHIVNWHADPRRTYTPRDVTHDDAWAAGYARLAAHGLSFDLQAYPGQFPHLARLIERHPETPVMVNHMGMCVPGEEAEWRAGLTALAALPHVAIKLSGIGFTYRSWTLEQARGLVLTAIDRFGTDRAMVASDFPTDKLFGSFAATLGAYDTITADFGDAERRALFAGNANRLYRLGLTL